jgi:hypothetical protein
VLGFFPHPHHTPEGHAALPDGARVGMRKVYYLNLSSMILPLRAWVKGPLGREVKHSIFM